MVVQGLQVMSDWLNIMMSFCCLVGSYLPEVLIVPCLGEPWSVFHHIHNLSTVPAMEEVSLVSRSIWPLAPLWLDPDLDAGFFLNNTLWLTFEKYCRVSESWPLLWAQEVFPKRYIWVSGVLCLLSWIWLPLSVEVRWVPLLLMVQIAHLSSLISGLRLQPDHPPSSTKHQISGLLSAPFSGYILSLSYFFSR